MAEENKANFLILETLTANRVSISTASFSINNDLSVRKEGRERVMQHSWPLFMCFEGQPMSSGVRSPVRFAGQRRHSSAVSEAPKLVGVLWTRAAMTSLGYHRYPRGVL